MSNVFDTQQIQLDLIKQLLQTEEQLVGASGDVEKLTDLGYQIKWLKKKINFLGSSEYQRRKKESRGLL